jgi:hypothetical protein
MNMNDFNDNNGDIAFSQKSKEAIIKLLKTLFDLRNIVKAFELIMLLFFKLLYGKQPVFTW